MHRVSHACASVNTLLHINTQNTHSQSTRTDGNAGSRVQTSFISRQRRHALNAHDSIETNVFLVACARLRSVYAHFRAPENKTPKTSSANMFRSGYEVVAFFSCERTRGVPRSFFFSFLFFFFFWGGDGGWGWGGEGGEAGLRRIIPRMRFFSFFLLKVENSSRTQIPLFKPGSAYRVSASLDYCRRAFPGELPGYG